MAPRIRTTVTDLLEVRDMNVLQQITKLINTGDLTVVVSRTAELDQVAKDLAENVTGHAGGKTAVLVSRVDGHSNG